MARIWWDVRQIYCRKDRRSSASGCESVCAAGDRRRTSAQGGLVFRPYPTDVFVRRTNTEVEFVTPANSSGIGTIGQLVRTDQAISGIMMLFPTNELDAVQLNM